MGSSLKCYNVNMTGLQRSIQTSFHPSKNPLGVMRVMGPQGRLPQAAERLDPSLPLFSDETRVKVKRLNLDSASFRQLKENSGGDPIRIGAQVMAIVRQRGKMQNPVTGSGGMLLGEIEERGPEAPGRFSRGDSIATLVSLTLTPMYLERVIQVEVEKAQIDVEGYAILFASSPAVKMPEDLSESAALAALDVCGAPAWVRRIVRKGDRVLLIGAGKSAVLSAYAAMEALGLESLPWVSDVSEQALGRVRGLGVFGGLVCADAQNPIAFHDALKGAGAPDFDWVINACNAPETEAATVLAARQGGKCLFFNMATQFNRAVLSAEGLGRDLELWMGNGYAEGHAEYALDLLRRHEKLKKFFGG